MTEIFSLAIHGGAGTIRRSAMSPEREAEHHAGLRTALLAGHAVLADGGSAVEAVTRAVMALEDDPLFNSGRGAVFTTEGRQEMDAAIMDGQDRAAGAVAGIIGPRNPILAARAVMDSEHVLLTGAGAIEFCRAAGVEFADADYFYTEQRWQALRTELLRRREGGADLRDDAARHGTVGAVARDRLGNLAAATSTGGMTAKPPGRVGDSPVFGAGTWAENTSCAISATGHGEFFIRFGVAHEIAARMRLARQSLERASGDVVAELAAIGGSGGLIAVDAQGRIALPFNSSGMYRGLIRTDGAPHTAIYQDDP